MLDLVGVRQRYRGRGEVLSGVHLRVAPGAPCVVLGANGSGKSTLLRLAAGVAAPSAGRVRGRPPVVGFLPAPYPASSRLTARSYLRHLVAIHGGGHQARRRAEELLEQLGFSGARDGPMSELSTGNAQKVGLAQALCASPGLVVLDEPWTALDADAAAVLDRRLYDVTRSVSVLIADHSGRGIDLPGARVHRLRDGVIHAEEPGREPTAVGAWNEIEVWCPAPAEQVLPQLPEAAASRCSGRRLQVRVEPSRSDAWLAAALTYGCSVTLVRRGTGTDR